jgi:integrase
MGFLSLDDYVAYLRGSAKNLRPRTIDEYTRHVRHALKTDDFTAPLRAAKSVSAWGSVMTALRHYVMASGKPDPKEVLTRTCPRPRVPRKIRRPVPEGAWQQLLQSGKLEGPHGCFLRLLMLTGLRLGDALGLSREIMESALREGEVVIIQKGGHERLWSPDENIHPILRELLTYSWEHLQDLWGKHWRSAQNRVRDALAEACVAAGVSYANPHRFRHAFATSLSARGTTLADIQFMMGHASPQTTANYIHPTGSTMRKASKKLTDDLMGGSSD